jgi:hypothetical protein
MRAHLSPEGARRWQRRRDRKTSLRCHRCGSMVPIPAMERHLRECRKHKPKVDMEAPDD